MGKVPSFKKADSLLANDRSSDDDHVDLVVPFEMSCGPRPPAAPPLELQNLSRGVSRGLEAYPPEESI